MRDIISLANRLPIIDSDRFRVEFMTVRLYFHFPPPFDIFNDEIIHSLPPFRLFMLFLKTLQNDLKEYTDSSIVTYLAAMTKATQSLNELVDKCQIAFDRRSGM